MVPCTLDAWLAHRPTLTPDVIPPPPTRAPGASMSPLAALARHIERRVAPRDAAKARQLDDAAAWLHLHAARAPDVEGLFTLGALILGAPAASVRTTTAWAHGARARMRPFARDELDAAVAGAAIDADGPPWFRAARLYADVCFFHPCDDGNARLALCAFVWVLTRAGCSVVDLGPLIMPWAPSSSASLLRVARAITAG